MQDFLVMISEILIIMCIQQLSEVLLDPATKPYQVKLLSAACFAGSFSIILQYIFTHVLKDLVSALRFAF